MKATETILYRRYTPYTVPTLFGITPPKFNSLGLPLKNGWLEDDPASFWHGTFSGANCETSGGGTLKKSKN